MNWPLITAGSLAIIGTLIHGIIGDRIVRRLEPEALQGNPFGSGRNTKFLIRVTWHFTTIAFATLGIALVVAGVSPRSAAALGIAYGAGALFTCWASLVLVAGFVRGGPRQLFAHPAPLMLSVTAVLVWLGASWL
ncbi:MAG: hypothetical protein ABR579_02055 [Actinomycetota bacterium]